MKREGGGRGNRRRPARPRRRRWAVPAALAAVALAALALWRAGVAGEVGAGAAQERGGPPAERTAAPAAARTAAAVPAERLRARVLASYPHDPGAYTQGLLLHDGTLYESAGQYGESTLRRVELTSGRVVARRELAPDQFAEGLARVPGRGGEPDRLVQLTWREGVAQVWSLPALEPLATHRYAGEGWGLCHDATVPGGRLVMSDGSPRLTFRDPATFAVTGGVDVTLDGRPLPYLNELECVDGTVWANVFTSDGIVAVDPASGRVTALVDASGLLSPDEAMAAEVLNGIAHDPADGALLVTGKRWPRLFRVELVPAAP